jgi:hypothetical protein
MLTVRSILKGTFGVLRDHPKAVGAWCVAEAAATALSTFLMRPMNRMVAASADPSVPLPTASAARVSLILGELVGLAVFIVVVAAVMRAVLKPREEKLAYLRVGLDELRLLALGILWAVVLYALFVVATVLAAMVAVQFVRVGDVEAAKRVIAIVLLLVSCVLIWLQMRLGLAFPLTLLRGRFVIGESWRLTRGRFWRLFGASAVIVLLMIALVLVVLAVMPGPAWGDVFRGDINSEAARQASARQAAANLAVTPVSAIAWILSGILGGLSAALFGGGAAAAARLLVVDVDSIAETFA